MSKPAEVIQEFASVAEVSAGHPGRAAAWIRRWRLAGNSSAARRAEVFSAGAATLAVMLVLLSVKLWLIATYANAVPFWDQWDAEAAYLLDPYLRGQLHLVDLFSAHNEHRIFFTRLLALVLFELNGLWSPLLEMTVNAFLHVGALALLTLLAWRTAGRGTLPMLLALALAVFVVPYGYENTLVGFQSQFYFVLLFSFAALWYLAVAPVASRAWWAGVALAGMAYFSLASGVFAFGAAAGALIVRGALLRDRKRDLSGAALLLVLFVLAMAFVPTLARHAALRASDLHGFVAALVHGLAWPFDGAAMALVRNAPLLAFLAWVLRERPPARDPRWFLFALALWCLGQEASLAFGRVEDVLTPRYMDLHSVTLFASGASLVLLLAGPARRFARVAVPLGVLWAAACVAALAYGPLYGPLPVMLQRAARNTGLQQANLVAYLRDGDRAKLLAQPFMHLPYPSAERLAWILDSPLVRAILPMQLQMQIAPASMDGHGFGFPGVPPSAASCNCRYLGTFGPEGSAGTGEASVTYAPRMLSLGDARVSFLVAGYPSRGGWVELRQQGDITRLRFDGDPGEQWQRRTVAVRPGPFELRFADTSQEGWIAVSDPVPAGRLDAWAEGIQQGWLRFLIAGAALLAVAVFAHLWVLSRHRDP